MLELISIFCSLALIVLVLFQTSQIIAGTISPKFTGTPAAYAAAFHKQIGLYVWLGAVFGAIDFVLIFLDPEPGEWIVRLVGALLWIGVSAVSLYSRQRLAKLATPSDA